MNFFEPACRIPLIVHAPGRFPARRIAQSASLLDVAPTLLELAGCGPADRATPLDGRSLYPQIAGAADPGADEVIGEYLAEGAVAPLVMIRRGRFKFVHSPGDPDQLFDLGADPDELENLAPSARHAPQVREFREEVRKRWNLDDLHAAVLQSQRRRHLVYRALRTGRFTPWDHQPFKDASKQYVRNDIDLGDLETQARFPPVDRAPAPR
jgi:choline-sulfatase